MISLPTLYTSDFPEVRSRWSYVGVAAYCVLKKLSGLKVNKAVGPFDPKTRIIKLFARYFAAPLEHIFSESLASRLFSDI